MSELTLTDSRIAERPKGGRVASTELTSDIRKIREEIDGYYREMIQFPAMEADEIFQRLSAYTARVSYIRSSMMRTDNRALVSLRTKEIDPFISECDRQFKIWSRVFSVQTLDWNLARNTT